MTSAIAPDPSAIGGVPEAPFAVRPDPGALFAARAARFAFLAQSGNLGPYLRFLADLTGIQARLVAEIPPADAPAAERVRICRESRMPPLDRAARVADPALHQTFARFCEAAAALEMPDPARLALAAVRAAAPADRDWLLGNVLSDTIPDDLAAPHLFAACAVQLYMARLAATLDAGALVAIATGTCPACGGRPATSSVMATQGIENIRYATCACCATRWNEVRIKCLCCGSGKGLAYRSVETVDASVKAETCSACNHWVKILYLAKNPTLDPIADDVGSLGLDLLMRETPFRRGGFNPFLVGY